MVHNNQIKIADLGLSKIRNENTSTSKVFGNTAYIDPQCYIKINYKRNEKSDIYSLGVLFWEISSGKPPFSDVPIYRINLEIVNGKREIPIPDTPIDYINIYTSIILYYHLIFISISIA